MDPEAGKRDRSEEESGEVARRGQAEKHFHQDENINLSQRPQQGVNTGD